MPYRDIPPPQEEINDNLPKLHLLVLDKRPKGTEDKGPHKARASALNSEVPQAKKKRGRPPGPKTEPVTASTPKFLAK